MGIVWDVSPQIFKWSIIELRWYGLLFASGFLIGYHIVQWMFRLEKINPLDASSLLTHTVLGTLIGARLGHCLFYEPAYYLSHPIEILMINKGGLASHGGVIGVILGCLIYSKKKRNQPFWWVVDRLTVVTTMTGGLIRLGNFMNSEILGKPTDLPWAVTFMRSHLEQVPRHPAQLYESLAYFIIFGVALKIYFRFKGQTPHGLITGVCCSLVFTFRFFIEFVKENQVNFEQGWALNMGQLLSIPAVGFGIFLAMRALKSNSSKNSPLATAGRT